MNSVSSALQRSNHPARKTTHLQRTFTAAVLFGLTLLAACQSAGTPGADPASGGPSAAILSSSTLPGAPGNSDPAAARARPYYVRVQPEATSLQAVNDDGENTFIEFGILPPGELKFFDAEGRPLRAVWVRNIALVAGTHSGILIRLGTATSYISLNPQAERLRKPALQETAVVHELREKLLQESQRGAMERALAKANQIEPSVLDKAGVEPRAATRASLVAMTETQAAENLLAREAMERALSLERVQPRGTNPNATTGSPGNAAPLNAVAANSLAPAIQTATAAQDAAEAPWPRTLRVFFASNSVGITAPEDGMHRLLSDARQSGEIWISGHTDSIGTRAANEWLARRRAAAIKHILVSRGVAPERIVVVRAPADTYIAGNETDVGRAQNRRVEVTFMRTRSGTPTAALETPAPRAGIGN